jgi:hypothetical protein
MNLSGVDIGCLSTNGALRKWHPYRNDLIPVLPPRDRIKISAGAADNVDGSQG